MTLPSPWLLLFPFLQHPQTPTHSICKIIRLLGYSGSSAHPTLKQFHTPLYEFQIACPIAHLLPRLEFFFPYCNLFPSSILFLNGKSLLFRKFISTQNSFSVYCSLIKFWSQIHIFCSVSSEASGTVSICYYFSHGIKSGILKWQKKEKKKNFYNLWFPFLKFYIYFVKIYCI